MADSLTEAPAAPQLKLHSASLHVVVVATCQCGHTPIVVTGISDLATCPRCAARYIVKSIQHEAKPDGTVSTNVEIGRLSDLALPSGVASPFGKRKH